MSTEYAVKKCQMYRIGHQQILYTIPLGSQKLVNKLGYEDVLLIEQRQKVEVRVQNKQSKRNSFKK